MNTEATTPALLSIGINSGGISPRNRSIHEVLGAFQRLVIREREGLANAGLRMNIVFDVPGPFFQPDYEGVHATRIDRKRDHLLVVAAVPADVTQDDMSTYLAEVLGAARAEARDFIAKRKLQLTLAQLELLMEHLITELDSTANRP